MYPGVMINERGSSLGTKFRKVRTFCEHSSCDGVHRGDATGVWVLLESEPVLDFPHGPNALVMRRSGVRISEAAPRFWLVLRQSVNFFRTFFE